MGGLDSVAAAAPVTTAARLVADAYMAAPADVAVAPTTATAAVGPVSRMEFISRNKLVWTLYGLCRMNLYGLDLNLWLLINGTRVYLYVCISG